MTKKRAKKKPEKPKRRTVKSGAGKRQKPAGQKKVQAKAGKEGRRTRGPARAVATAAPAQEGSLGRAGAIAIATRCANTVAGNLPRTLTELGLNGLTFQTCVFNDVTGRGFVINRASIPNGPGNTLLDVVNVVQNAASA